MIALPVSRLIPDTVSALRYGGMVQKDVTCTKLQYMVSRPYSGTIFTHTQGPGWSSDADLSSSGPRSL